MVTVRRWGRKYAAGKWSEACLLSIYQSDNGTSCNVKCKKIISSLQTSAMCCNILVNTHASAPSICHECLLCLSRSACAGVTWLITDINNGFLSWEDGNKGSRDDDNNNDDDNENKWNKVTHEFFPFVKMHRRLRASKANVFMYKLFFRTISTKCWIFSTTLVKFTVKKS